MPNVKSAEKRVRTNEKRRERNRRDRSRMRTAIKKVRQAESAETARDAHASYFLALAAEAGWWYRNRFRIEPFFADQKSRGFRLHQSHLSDPARLTRLLLAACLAYLWSI